MGWRLTRSAALQDGGDEFLQGLEGDGVRLVIELLGEPYVEVLQSDAYFDAGAVAVSPVQGILPRSAVQVGAQAAPAHPRPSRPRAQASAPQAAAATSALPELI